MSLFGSFLAVAFVATSAVRDFEAGTDELVFSRPLDARVLLLGRFLGALAAACAAFAGAALGLFLGGLVPWLDPARVGPHDPRPHLFGLLVLAFPSLAIVGSLLFALACRLRHVVWAYVALVALLVAYFAAGAAFTELHDQHAAALLDPFGLTAFARETRYWTVAERNTRLVGLGGDLLWSRLLWLGLGAALPPPPRSPKPRPRR
jgi:hypothetical protein